MYRLLFALLLLCSGISLICAQDASHATLRGGSWFFGPSVVRVSFRSWGEPDIIDFNGFRYAGN